jgi:hypothetical protein
MRIEGEKRTAFLAFGMAYRRMDNGAWAIAPGQF